MFQDTPSSPQDGSTSDVQSTVPVRKKRGGRPGGNPNLSNPAGRPKGIPNKTTRVFKEAILYAAAAVGEDGLGRGELEGFLIAQARKPDNSPFMSLLGKVLPLTIQGDKNNPLVHHVKVTLVRSEKSTQPGDAAKVVNAKLLEQKR